ncbi:MAG: hypothetical protein NTW52_20140 [Planctomycetota bacterium]|nr:hypothetical protein [Planctomycetota bacterium]
MSDESNFHRLASALVDLHAECIAVPEFEAEYLARGHAVHFRCQHPDAKGIRLDVMTKMRGCDEFEQLWERRTSIEDPAAGIVYELLSIEDLVKAKKTQRDKDWPMIRRLMEAHHRQFAHEPTPAIIGFWLRELITPELLQHVSLENQVLLPLVKTFRPWLLSIDLNDIKAIERKLETEKEKERLLDVAYWQPLKQELAELRASKRSVNE